MSANIRLFALLTLVIALAACTTGESPAPPPSASVSRSAAAAASAVDRSASPAAPATPAPTAVPTPATVPTAFTSRTYGYALTVPAGWIAIQASRTWDGISAVSHDSAEVDQFVMSDARAASGLAAPTSGDTKALVSKTISDTAKYHGDTCKPGATLQAPVKVGSQPGILLAFDCGILINNAVVVANGIGYTFLFRDRSVHSPTDAADQAIFEAVLRSVRLP
jgi:hypothetical protein